MSSQFNGFKEAKYLKWKERKLKKQQDQKQGIGLLEKLNRSIDFEIDRVETELAWEKDVEAIDSSDELSDSGESSDSEEPLNDCPTKPITMSRTVWARIDQKLHPDLVKLYERYILDQQLAEEKLANTNTDIKEAAKFEKYVGMMADTNEGPNKMDDFEKCKKIIERCAMYEQIANRTDVDMKRLGLVESAEGAWGQLSEEAFYLFEELFEICKRPNEAEIDMLGRVVRMDPVDIQRWFEWKNKRYQFSNLLETLNSEAGPRVEAFLRKILREKRYKPRSDQNEKPENEVDGEGIDDSWLNPEDYI